MEKSEECQIIISNDVIGRGTESVVFAGTAKIQDRTMKTAVKLVPIDSVAFDNEIWAMEQLGIDGLLHAGLPNLVEVFEESNCGGLVYERVDGIDLLVYLNANKGHMSLQMIEQIFLKLVVALDACHQRGVAHGDIKLENVMVRVENGFVRDVVLIDFGLSKSCTGVSHKWSGSIHYAAPEVMSRIPFEAAPADMWGLGVLLFSLLAESFPFSAESVRNQDYLVPSLPSQVSCHPLAEFALKLLNFKPEYRPSCEDILGSYPNF